MNSGCHRWRSFQVQPRWKKPFCKPRRFPMPLHDASYKHYQGVHLGVWRRRWAITFHGLTACFQNKLTQRLAGFCWITSLLITIVLFLVGQLLVPDSLVGQAVE